MRIKIISASFRTNVMFLMFFVFGSVTVFGQSNNCNAEISAIKNRDNKKVVTTVHYKMVITNKGNLADVFTLSSENINSTCANIDGSSTINNVILNYSFLDVDKNPITKVELKSGESYNFLVLAEVPVGTPLEKWSCIEVSASSKLCADFKVSTVLQTYVFKPSEE
ncbi:hypothetical protein ACFQ5N_12515 [Lutibacter holmesii]|uniref:Fn3-like domain-containing protein n=1 Tax=Lutibacter holmesii TaxID=1137985 RepID=A0ABW3WRG1_9FLAO